MKPVYLVYWNSGSGIGKDLSLLRESIRQAGYPIREVVTHDRADRKERMAKFCWQMLSCLWRKRWLQIHVEQIHREQFRFGKHNFLIPNPEFTDIRVFGKMKHKPVLLAKTRHAEQLFREAGLPTAFLGFSSPDRMMGGVGKRFDQFLHVAGRSRFKGTSTLERVWRKHPEWPRLTVVQSGKDCYGNPIPIPESASNIRVLSEWLPEETLCELQNESGIHLCPSVMEGFGHYIVEGLSCGSVVVTTDAPPMNELVDEACGLLLPCRKSGISYMDAKWEVEDAGIEAAVEQILGMDWDALAGMGRAGRARYEERDRSFRERFRGILERSMGKAPTNAD